MYLDLTLPAEQRAIGSLWVDEWNNLLYALVKYLTVWSVD